MAVAVGRGRNLVLQPLVEPEFDCFEDVCHFVVTVCRVYRVRVERGGK